MKNITKKFILTSAVVASVSASIIYVNSVNAGEAPKDKQKEATAANAAAVVAQSSAATSINADAPAAEQAPKVVSPDNKLFTTVLPNDIVIGENSAPIKIIEYASLSCSHCKHFHDEVYYELKKRFIDTGKVQFTFRHFPLNAPAIKAALIVGCAPADSKQAFLGAFFKSQQQWAFVDNESDMHDKLKIVAKIGGMDDAVFEQCFNDEKKQDEVLSLMKQANEELSVETTPSIFIDGVRFDGARTIESFAEVINEKLQKAKK